LAPEPIALDPAASVMLDVIDGAASISELALDVHEEIGLPLEEAREQVARVIGVFESAGLLTSSRSDTTAEEAIARRPVFIGPETPCSENASRLGTETLLLQFEAKTIRVACDSRRGARKLRAALSDHVVDGPDDASLAFVLTAPQGLQRKHRLVDRTGFVLSEAPGLDAGLHALAAHLTAFLPTAPNTVRVRARGLAAGDRTVVCLPPVLYWPDAGERELAGGGFSLIDRLVLDVDVNTGLVTNPDIPWPTLRSLGPARNHLGTGGTRPITAVVAAAPIGSASPTAAQVAARLAAEGLHGSPAQLLTAASTIAQRAELRSARDGDRLVGEVLAEFSA
jgi:hypothetical protein